MQIDLLKEECVLIKSLVEEASDEAENEIRMFSKDAPNEQVTTALMVRAFGRTIKKKMEIALAE